MPLSENQSVARMDLCLSVKTWNHPYAHIENAARQIKKLVHVLRGPLNVHFLGLYYTNCILIFPCVLQALVLILPVPCVPGV
jgi:hypothetical protein